MKKIALDLDGVLLNTLGKFIEIWNIIKEDNKTLEDIKRFGFYEDWGISESIFWAFFDMCKTEKLDPIDPKAPKYVKRLRTQCKIDIVTARKESERELIEGNLKDIGMIQGIHYDNLIIVPRLIDSPKIDLPYDVYIDDNPLLAKDIKAIQQFEDRVLLLWQQPWNWMIESGSGVFRVGGWKSIMKWFGKHSI